MPNVDSVQGIRVALAWASRRMIAGKLDTTRARTLGYLAGMMLETYRVEDDPGRTDSDFALLCSAFAKTRMANPGKGMGASRDSEMQEQPGEV
jgi:hypothetical protein